MTMVVPAKGDSQRSNVNFNINYTLIINKCKVLNYCATSHHLCFRNYLHGSGHVMPLLKNLQLLPTAHRTDAKFLSFPRPSTSMPGPSHRVHVLTVFSVSSTSLKSHHLPRLCFNTRLSIPTSVVEYSCLLQSELISLSHAFL